MGYPSIDEIAEQCASWDFIENLPKEINGFTKVKLLQKKGQLLYICSFINKKARIQLDIIYTAETFDYILIKKIGLNEYRDIRFIYKKKDVFAKEINVKLDVLTKELMSNNADDLGYLVKEKGILDWEYGNSLPTKIGNFELYIKPSNAIRYLNGSIIFVDYSDFTNQDQLVILYNVLRDEIFAELKIGGAFQTLRDFDVCDLQELEKRLSKYLKPLLENIRTRK